MAASSGDPLSGASFVETVRASLLPLVDCLTPNLAEAAALLDEPVARSEADMARQGEALLKLGPRAVLMKGGHLDGDEAIDVLVTEGAVHRFAAPKLYSEEPPWHRLRVVERHCRPYGAGRSAPRGGRAPPRRSCGKRLSRGGI